MAEREKGIFRGRLFGGFHRQDVLDHLNELYTEMDELRAEAEAAHARAQEIEHLLSSIETASTRKLKIEPILESTTNTVNTVTKVPVVAARPPVEERPSPVVAPVEQVEVTPEVDPVAVEALPEEAPVETSEAPMPSFLENMPDLSPDPTPPAPVWAVEDILLDSKIEDAAARGEAYVAPVEAAPIPLQNTKRPTLASPPVPSSTGARVKVRKV